MSSAHEIETGVWTTEDAKSLYMIDRWGRGYFDVSPDGNLTVAPLQERGSKIAIRDVVDAALEQGLRTPLLIRFQDLLHHRVRSLNEAFNKAIAESKFRGTYRGVFPIKVNQLREVVEEILDAGKTYHYGVEVGSKPEVFAGLSVHHDPESLIVCNGYKDENFIRTALIGRKLGKKVILIAEKLSEVRMITRVAKDMNVEPMIGLRVRLLTEGAGKWKTSGGENAKFGLSTAEILAAIRIMDEAGMSASFKLLHFHIGSQVPDILIIKRAVREATRYYAKLRKMGQRIEYIDVGGGLAIDYDGSRSTFHSSMNYSVEEYARDIVHNIADICDEERVPHPNIVSESGRAIVAHHSVLVVQAFGSIEKTPMSPIDIQTEEHKLIQNLLYIKDNLSGPNLGESWHDLLQIKEEAQKMFELGLLNLDVKARVEILFWEIAEAMQKIASELDPEEVPDDLGELRKQLADQYICNFSVFQSLLDHWALGALFPIVPIHRLNERPAADSTLVDITCDSDGKVSKFIDLNDVKDTIPLHPIVGEQPYYVGIFLTGAYQDIMGDIHNLFGRVNEVHVFLDEDEESGYYIEETIAGNKIHEVLALTQYDNRDLVGKVKAQVDGAIKQDLLKPTEGMRLLADYERGLKDQTYLSL
ncbi:MULTISPECIES: biosynthetic arginine decarboxylase [Sorangium]|uniref:Arginine decarboxylase n=1 Tax=Sorangium cellulosum TaxID=56 RepID=A0A4P2QLX1_SORCE|nr:MULTISPECIES: biosynthetic arginine decarboxylase [Sorangium]AUX30990.1 arginine decarboxylase [Sorangium cellulosum]WCQ90372.1 Biosynthetic arginine decarboxylase [Sorangium sp. Soce836]